MRNYKEYIDKNKIALKKAIEIDNNKWEEENTLENIIEKEKIKVNLEKNKAYLIIYEGQPEITMQLLEKAILVNSSIVFTIKDYYLATNKVLISIANKLVQESQKQVLYKLYNNIENEKIYEATQNPDETIYLGNKEDFEYIKNKIHGKVKFIEYNE